TVTSSLPVDGPATSTTITAGLAGTAAQDSLPSEASIVVTIRTLKRGRSFRGRVYLPPFVVSQVDANGNVIASCVTSLTNQFGLWMTDILSNAPGKLVVASYLHATSEDSTNPNVDNKFDVQRRRK